MDVIDHVVNRMGVCSSGSVGREMVPPERRSTRIQIVTGVASTNGPPSFLPLLGGEGREGESQRLVRSRRRCGIRTMPSPSRLAVFSKMALPPRPRRSDALASLLAWAGWECGPNRDQPPTFAVTPLRASFGSLGLMLTIGDGVGAGAGVGDTVGCADRLATSRSTVRFSRSAVVAVTRR